MFKEQNFSNIYSTLDPIMVASDHSDRRTNPLTSTTASGLQYADGKLRTKVDDSNNCNGFYRVTDTPKYILYKNLIFAQMNGIPNVIDSLDEVEIFIRKYSHDMGYSLRVIRSSSMNIIYGCPIKMCNFVCEYRYEKGSFNLVKYHIHDTNKCSRFQSKLVFLTKKGNIPQKIYDKYYRIDTSNNNDENTIPDNTGNESKVSLSINENNNEEEESDCSINEIEFLLTNSNKSNDELIDDEIYLMDDIESEVTPEEKKVIDMLANDNTSNNNNGLLYTISQIGTSNITANSNIDVINTINEEPLVDKNVTTSFMELLQSESDVTIDAFLNDTKNDKNSFTFIPYQNRKLFNDPMNIVFLNRYLHLNKSYFLNKPINNIRSIIEDTFPSIKTNYIYKASKTFLSNDNSSTSYIPSIIEEINRINPNNKAFYMLCPKKTTDYSKHFSKNIYEQILSEEYLAKDSALLCCGTIVYENIPLIAKGPYILFLDGTFLSVGSMVTLVITSVNLNHESICLAYGFFPSESEASWSILLQRFLGALNTYFDTTPTFTVISDQAKGISSAVSHCCPSWPHVFCLFHLLQEFNTMRPLEKLECKEAYQCKNENELESHLKNIKNTEARKKIDEMWHYNNSQRIRCESSICEWYVASSVAESYNRLLKKYRSLPIHLIMIFIFNQTLTKQMKIKDTINPGLKYLPFFTKMVTKSLNKTHEVVYKEDKGYVSFSDGKVYTVDLYRKTCTCFSFQNLLMPCKHAAVLINYCLEKNIIMESDIYQLCSGSLNNTYYETYYNYKPHQLIGTDFLILSNPPIWPPLYAIRKRGPIVESAANCNSNGFPLNELLPINPSCC
ncbi:hypothetical protein WA158_006815 [Blastocystis sp. Blastoise]